MTYSFDNQLLDPIRELLIASPGVVWNEHQVIQWLVKDHWVSKDYGRASLSLFQTHFLVMNALYQLRNEFLQQSRGYLKVSALSIVLHPPEPTAEADGRQSPDHQLPERGDEASLDEYYLNWQNFAGATEVAVDDLLGQFWQKYILAEDQREALQLLELDSKVTFADIQRRYRQLAMLWHPDRGGCNEKLANLNRAFKILKRYYKT